MAHYRQRPVVRTHDSGIGAGDSVPLRIRTGHPYGSDGRNRTRSQEPDTHKRRLRTGESMPYRLRSTRQNRHPHRGTSRRYRHVVARRQERQSHLSRYRGTLGTPFGTGHN